jgi:hypothetical protein
MSITIRQQPDIWTPIYNPMVFVLDSTNTAQSNFKYIADIYVSGVTDYVRLTIDADPTYDQGLVDIHRIVESHVTNSPGYKTLSGFQKASQSMIAYEVKFGEQYGVASAVTNYPNLTVTGTKYAFNGAYTPHDWLSFDGTDFAIEDTGSILSDYTGSRLTTMSSTDDSYIHYVTNTSGTVYYAEIKTYDSTGSLIQTAKIENDYQDVGAYDQRRMVFYSGVRALNAASLSSGSQPVIDSSVYSYTVALTNYAGINQLYGGLPITFTRNDNCLANRSPLTVHWLNTKGGFDSYQFTMINRYKASVKRTTYEKTVGSMGSNSWSYNYYDQSKTVIDTDVQVRYELQSDWISMDDQYLISQLIESPLIFVDNGGNFLPVVIVSPTESEFKSVSLGDNELNSLKLVVELSMDYWKQRG